MMTSVGELPLVLQLPVKSIAVDLNKSQTISINHFTDQGAYLTSRSNVPPKSVGSMPIQRSKAVQFGGK